MFKRPLLLLLGSLSLLAGGLGAFLPLLPTTPFVILAAGCYGAASPQLYQRLAGTRFFGEYIRNYREKTGISHKNRWAGIIALWLMLGLSIFVSATPGVSIFLLVVGVCVTAHLLLLKGKRPDDKGDSHE